MRIFILGAGATGAFLGRLLARQGHSVWFADRDPQRARRFLDPALPCQPVSARNLWGLVRAGRGCHLLVNAAPAAFNHTVLRAALRLRAHYLDMASHLSRHPFKAEQLRFDEKFRGKRRAALITVGVAPGLTNLIVKRSAELCERLQQVQIRLYESTQSEDPVSTWSAETAFDEAVSRPRVYRAGRFRFAPRFGEPEWFRFPAPMGRTRVVLAAQDEVGTLPHFIPMQDMDVKIGGNEIDRLRRWYHQGKLRPSATLVKKRFPRTPTPRQVARLIRRGLLSNARFAAVVVVRGRRADQEVEFRWSCAVPTLYQIRLKGLHATPIAYATAHTAALFIKHFPRKLWGVHPPETLPGEVRRAILGELKSRGIEITLKKKQWKRPEEEEDEDF
ncbi:MAG: saccharopine dehydrogenase NADP-binding domain-containing protein [Terriglobia bacterium]